MGLDWMDVSSEIYFQNELFIVVSYYTIYKSDTFLHVGESDSKMFFLSIFMNVGDTTLYKSMFPLYRMAF